MSDWTCGPKCPYWSAYGDAHGYDGLCRAEYPRNKGDECVESLGDWELDLRNAQADLMAAQDLVTVISAYTAARRAAEGEGEPT